MNEATESADPAGNLLLAVLVWLWVVAPFGYGLYQLVVKIPALFSN
ncbi:MAG: MFS transporter small subunit [Pseudonocardia sp.]